MTLKNTISIIAGLLLTASAANALENGLARTPPMGWNSWNNFGCDVSESLIRETADAMVASGMRDAGYQYIVIDDCWQVSRDADGNIVVDPDRFPSGMKALADYVHSKGLKFGLYSCAGEFTCGGRPGSKGHEYQDARQYAAWGVDYLKYDWCYADGLSAPESYAFMRDALKDAGRPIVFSICEWGSTDPWTWAEDVGNLWRTTGDIADAWSSEGRQGGPPPGRGPGGREGSPQGGRGTAASEGRPQQVQTPPPPPVPMGLGFLQILDLQETLADYAGPGHWNDPDMMEVGNGGMTNDEYRAHFSLWAVLAAPLMAGNDLRSMSPDINEILTNKEIIAVSQDVLGRQGRRIKREGDADVWMKELSGGGRCIALLNRGESPLEMTVSWSEVGLAGKDSATVRDLWQHKDLGSHTGRFSATVAGHSVVVVKLQAP